jgi:hypothetical protein
MRRAGGRANAMQMHRELAVRLGDPDSAAREMVVTGLLA